MIITCATCGADVASEARFCRRCGSPVRAAAGHDGGTEQVSPQAATIPLSEEGRTTDGLAGGGEDSRGGASETTRVSRAELESILQRAGRAAQGADADPAHQQSHGRETASNIPAANRPAQQKQQQQSSGLPQNAAPPAEDFMKTRQSSPEVDFMKTRPSVPGEDFAGAGAPLSEEDLMKTRPAFPSDRLEGARPSGEEDSVEDITVIVQRPFSGGARPAPVQPTPVTGPLDGGRQQQQYDATAGAGTSAQLQPPPHTAGAPAGHAQGGRKNLWVVVGVASAALLVIGVVGAWFAVNYLRRPATETPTAAPVAPVAPDQRQLAEEKVIEAEALLASGDLNAAVERLREAVRLDPNHSRAHRRLGDILLETGSRAEAIEELRAVTRLEPNDFTAWRALAAAQLAEGLPVDAAESYKRLIALTEGQREADPNDMLAYADALRLAGRADEANALYQRLSTSTSADVAAVARQRLAELAAAVNAPTPVDPRDVRPNGNTSANTSTGTQANTSTATAPTPAAQPTAAAPTPQPTPQPAAELSPSERYRRGVELWRSNRGAAVTDFLAAARAGNPDANYYLGLNLVEGRDLGSLKRAEVVAALSYFQRAQSGSNAGQARRYAQQLEKEYDRIRNQPR